MWLHSRQRPAIVRPFSLNMHILNACLKISRLHMLPDSSEYTMLIHIKTVALGSLFALQLQSHSVFYADLPTCSKLTSTVQLAVRKDKNRRLAMFSVCTSSSRNVERDSTPVLRHRPASPTNRAYSTVPGA